MAWIDKKTIKSTEYTLWYPKQNAFLLAIHFAWNIKPFPQSIESISAARSPANSSCLAIVVGSFGMSNSRDEYHDKPHRNPIGVMLPPNCFVSVSIQKWIASILHLGTSRFLKWGTTSSLRSYRCSHFEVLISLRTHMVTLLPLLTHIIATFIVAPIIVVFEISPITNSCLPIFF